MLVIYKATDTEGRAVADMPRRLAAWTAEGCRAFGLHSLFRGRTCWMLYVRPEDPLPSFGKALPRLNSKGLRGVRVDDTDAAVPREWLDWLYKEPVPRTRVRWRGVAPDCLFWWGEDPQPPHGFDGVGVRVTAKQALSELAVEASRSAGEHSRAAHDTYGRLRAAVQAATGDVHQQPHEPAGASAAA